MHLEGLEGGLVTRVRGGAVLPFADHPAGEAGASTVPEFTEETAAGLAAVLEWGPVAGSISGASDRESDGFAFLGFACNRYGNLLRHGATLQEMRPFLIGDSAWLGV